MDEKKMKRAQFLPLLFIIVPIFLLTVPVFACFKDGEYTYVYAAGGQGISAAAVSMYASYSYVGGFANVCFYIALAIAVAASIYGAMPAFMPQILSTKVYRPLVLGAFALSSIFMILAFVFLALGVERASAAYFESVGRNVEKTSAFLHADITFYFMMAAPFVVTVWWGWSMAIDYRLSKKKD